MKLDKYIEETIKQIIIGVNAAKDFGAKNDAVVNPEAIGFSSKNSEIFYDLNTGTPIQQIEFDIQVLVKEGKSEASAPEITVGSSTFSDGSTSIESTNSSTNRIKFSVPVILPRTQNRRGYD